MRQGPARGSIRLGGATQSTRGGRPVGALVAVHFGRETLRFGFLAGDGFTSACLTSSSSLADAFSSELSGISMISWLLRFCVVVVSWNSTSSSSSLLLLLPQVAPP